MELSDMMKQFGKYVLGMFQKRYIYNIYIYSFMFLNDLWLLLFLAVFVVIVEAKGTVSVVIFIDVFPFFHRVVCQSLSNIHLFTQKIFNVLFFFFNAKIKKS